MKIFISILFAFCIATKVCSQDPQKIDSLNKLLQRADDDTIRALAISALVEEMEYTKPDSCLYYTELGLELINSSVVKARFARSNSFYLYSFELQMYERRAVAFSEKRNDLLAIQTAIKAKQLAESSTHKILNEITPGNLAEVYQNIGEAVIAKNLLLERLRTEKNKTYRQVWLANIGSCYYDLKNYDSALYYLEKVDPALPLGNKILGEKIWPFPTLYFGHVYVKKDDPQKAIPYYRTSIRYAQYDHYGFDLCMAYIGIANAFKELDVADSAKWYAIRCIDLANQLSLPTQSLEANTFLANLYESKGVIDSAYHYQKKADVLKDSLFNGDKIKEVQNYNFNEKLNAQKMQEERAAYQSDIRTYVLIAAVVVFLLIAALLYRNNLHKQKLNSRLQQQKEKVETTLTELRTTQAQLIQSEKMASLGELTAGIAHEIQNPLNFVNNFSEVNEELIGELRNEKENGKSERENGKSEREKGKGEKESELLQDIYTNNEKIILHGKRADAIVKNMLEHSRQSTGEKHSIDINALADEYLKIAYNSMRAKDKDLVAAGFNVTVKTEFDGSIGKINVVSQDIGRVLLNLYNNAFYAMREKAVSGGLQSAAGGYEPALTVSTKKEGNSVLITVRDNGSGIPQHIVDKIFQPFFTTKPAGQGTGLGLSLAYDTVKAHGGEIKVETQAGAGTAFIVRI